MFGNGWQAVLGVLGAEAGGETRWTALAVGLTVAFCLWMAVDVVFGFFDCFYGYRLMWFFCVTFGTMYGGLIGLAFGPVNHSLAVIRLPANFAIGAVLCTAFFWFFHRLFPILLGAVWGGALLHFAASLTPVGGGTIIFVAGAIVGAMAGWHYRKFLLILFIAFSGAGMLCASVYALVIYVVNSFQGSYAVLTAAHESVLVGLCTTVLGVIGTFVQYKYAAEPPPQVLRKPPEEEEEEMPSIYPGTEVDEEGGFVYRPGGNWRDTQA